MQELQKRQRVKKFLYSLPFLAIFSILAFFMARGAWQILSAERESASKVARLEEEMRNLEERRVELSQNIEKLGTEDGIVDEIRRKFNVARAGERVAIIVDERAKATSTEKSGKAWYVRLWNAMMFWK